MPFTIKKSTFCLRKMSALTSKKISEKRCSNVIVLLCTAETESLQGLMKTRAWWADFKSI